MTNDYVFIRSYDARNHKRTVVIGMADELKCLIILSKKRRKTEYFIRETKVNAYW